MSDYSNLPVDYNVSWELHHVYSYVRWHQLFTKQFRKEPNTTSSAPSGLAIAYDPQIHELREQQKQRGIPSDQALGC